MCGDMKYSKILQLNLIIQVVLFLWAFTFTYVSHHLFTALVKTEALL